MPNSDIYICNKLFFPGVHSIESKLLLWYLHHENRLTNQKQSQKMGQLILPTFGDIFFRFIKRMCEYILYIQDKGNHWFVWWLPFVCNFVNCIFVQLVLVVYWCTSRVPLPNGACHAPVEFHKLDLTILCAVSSNELQELLFILTGFHYKPNRCIIHQA